LEFHPTIIFKMVIFKAVIFPEIRAHS